MKQLQRQPHSFISGRAMGLPGCPIRPLRTENGFTMVEVLVTVSVAAVITVAIAGIIITLMRLSPSSREQAVALRQVQNTGQWLTLDINMASNVERPEGTIASVIRLTQPRWDENRGEFVNTIITYRMDGKNLLREEQKAGEATVRSTTVAENVELAVYLPDDTNRPECCAQPAGTVPPAAFCIEITSEVGGVRGTNEVKRCYRVTPRVAQ